MPSRRFRGFDPGIILPFSKMVRLPGIRSNDNGGAAVSLSLVAQLITEK